MNNQKPDQDDIKRFVSEGLHKTRLNLLDLSARNRLLNFKQTGSKTLRFVDELPNQIFSELLSNADSEQKGGLTISPVPLPKKADYPEIEDSKSLQKIDVKVHAKKLGISIDWEMVEAIQSTEAKHLDDKLQTLLYPEDLDRLVRRVASEARTAIEESGVNMLFLCLGFLKWSDAKNSEVFYSSPLIMIPIEIERDAKINSKTGFSNFRMKYTGEDILDNICLREKLKQFSIELPSFDEFDSPEAYFSSLTSILKDIKPDWTIQRFITAGFLSFGKMLMYLDLDPARWPEIGGISDSEHIADIFSGNYSGDGSIASEYDVDTDENLPTFPHVMDADSSQHSAIIDVLNGKNIVIEGPPGTGKSQTITNLIAACLAQGKSVLFVAEKIAALQVVRKRLDSIGLGSFCLELHSHKTQKKAMMADLKRRLDMNSSIYRSAATTISDRMTELNQHKQKLIRYSNAINSPFGAMGETPHQIFWRTNVLQKEISQAYKVELFSPPMHVTATTSATLRSHLAVIKNLAEKLRDYYSCEYAIDNHYWHGFKLPASVDYAVQQDIYAGLKALGKAAELARKALNDIGLYGIDNDDVTKFKKISLDLNEFKESDFLDSENFDFLRSDNSSESILHACGDTRKLVSILDDYRQKCATYNIERIQAEGLFQQLAIENVQLPENISFKEIGIGLKTIDHAVADFERVASVFHEATAHLGLDGEKKSPQIFRIVKSVADFCSEIDKSILSARSQNIEDAIGHPSLEEITRSVLQLRLGQEQLSHYFELESVPTVERLKEVLGDFKAKGIFSFLSPRWKSSLATFKEFSKNKKEKDYQLAISKLESLIEHKSTLTAFNQNADFKSILPDLFSGIDTDIDRLRKGALFYRSLSKNTLDIPVFGPRLYSTLKKSDRILYDWFSQKKEDISHGLQAMNAISAMLAVTSRDGSEDDATAMVMRIKNSIAEFEHVEKILGDLKIPMTLNVEGLKSVKRLGEAARKAGDYLRDDAIVRGLNLAVSEDKLQDNLKLLAHLGSLAGRIEKVVPASAIPHLLCAHGFANLQAIKSCSDCISDYLTTRNELKAFIPELLHLKDFWGTHVASEALLLEHISNKLEHIDSENISFDKWCDISNSYEDVRIADFQETIASFSRSPEAKVPFLDYIPLFLYLFYSTLSNEALRQNKELGSFTRINHENIRDAFKSIDLELQSLNSQMLAREISRREIPEGSGGRSPRDFSDAQLIRHEIGKQKAHIPIRKLVARSYDALVAMKPCFMMGPLSVAQYLAPGHEKFDVLIMDEASQVKPEDAIGILARAKQVVVVGDSNQLPPTGFFDTLGDGGDGTDGDDDGTTIQDSESILDVCKPIFQPIRRLRWHYRSQHQSLISFSNRHFYENDLIVFPSPTAHSDLIGVKHIYVADGIYTSQSNPIEAQRVVQDVLQMIEQHPNRSYGVVTLNAKQKMVIEDEIERVRKENPVFDKFISDSKGSDEEFFVKNLENVQGDERDVIYISTTFGPDEVGAFRQNFGPINGKNGWRRLNVLFTRAKQHVRIFSSFHGDRIKVDDSKEQRGLRALKDYLIFSATGIDNHSYLTQKDAANDFESTVGSFLISKGYEVVYQLGVAGYLIDLVVKHPQKHSDYVIAIECDGATYHSARSARDRDRLREDNLRKLGWKSIYRIWSTDWFRRRELEEERLLKAVENAIKSYDDRFSVA